MEKKIAGCVILFNPDETVTANIISWYPEIDVLFIMDNSPMQHRQLIGQLGTGKASIHYQWTGENKGVAGALNEACRLALGAGCDWLLTMDQDSSFRQEGVAGMIGRLETIKNEFAPVGIISPAHLVSEHFIEKPAGDCKEVKFVMTSGNLLSLQAYQSVGPFEDKLFIDYVDVDYCLRLRKAGFRIVQVNGVFLQHSLGHFQLKKVGVIKMGVSNHSPGRRYYITRNKMYTLKKHFRFDPGFCWLVVRSMIGDFVRIIFFETNKWLKLRAIFIGIYHSMIDHYGRYAIEKT